MNTTDIINNKADISITETAAAKNQFCQVWPSVKTGLELLQNLLKNPIAKAAVGIVIAAGDGVSGKICG